jgi:hypothetical protein
MGKVSFINKKQPPTPYDCHVQSSARAIDVSTRWPQDGIASGKMLAKEKEIEKHRTCNAFGFGSFAGPVIHSGSQRHTRAERRATESSARFQHLTREEAQKEPQQEGDHRESEVHSGLQLGCQAGARKAVTRRIVLV